MMRGKKEEERGIRFMIGIIGAMPVEVDKLIEAMEETSRETVSMVQFHQGVLAGVPVVVACCGAGKVCSAVCAQTMILKYAPRLIINLGVAGGIGPRSKLGIWWWPPRCFSMTSTPLTWGRKNSCCPC